MSANKKQELLNSLTRRDANKPPMEVTYESKGVVLGQITDRPQVEGTGDVSTANVSDSSVGLKSTANEDETIIGNNNTVQESDTSNAQISRTKEPDTTTVHSSTTNESDKISVQMNGTNLYDTKNVHIESTHDEIAAASTEVLQNFKDLMKKETVEDTHTRKTFIVRNDLLAELDKLGKKHGRGFQTWFVNMAFERLIEEIRSTQKR